MAENQSGLTHRIDFAPPKVKNTLKKCFKSYLKCEILPFLVNDMYMLIRLVNLNFVQFLRFPVLDVGLSS